MTALAGTAIASWLPKLRAARTNMPGWKSLPCGKSISTVAWRELASKLGLIWRTVPVASRPGRASEVTFTGWPGATRPRSVSGTRASTSSLWSRARVKSARPTVETSPKRASRFSTRPAVGAVTRVWARSASKLAMAASASATWAALVSTAVRRATRSDAETPPSSARAAKRW